MIESLKDLERLIKLCRKQGVAKIDCQGISFELGEAPSTVRARQAQQEREMKEDPYKNFPSGELTPEQLIFYSSGGVPEDDPALRDAG